MSWRNTDGPRARIAAVFVLFGTACGGGPSVHELDQELEGQLARTRKLAARAADFDHDRVLGGIGTDPMNGTLSRLDEHLAEATHDAVGETRAEFRSELAQIDLEGGQFQPGGIVAYPVDLPICDVNALELQIASPPGERLEIELRSELSGEAVTIDLHVVGDDSTHTYRLELAEAFGSWSGERLVGVRLRAPDQRESMKFEIRSAVFLSHTAAYLDAAYGVAYRKKGRESRRSVFQWSSSVLRFSVQIERPVEAELDLGVSVLLSGGPVEIEVGLVGNGNKQRLMATQLKAADGWADRRLPLGRLSSGQYLIELRVSSREPNVVFWSNPAVLVAPARRFNVIMVLEDALRADHLSCYGYHRKTTPVKDALVRRGVRFARCYAQATKTRFSCPSFMTSLNPTATGVEGIWHPHPALHEEYITLAEVLRRRGFLTASIHQNPNAGSSAGLNQGFSYLFESVPGRAKDIYTGASLRFIEEHRDRNFMLYLHLADPHEPYDPPEGFRTWIDELTTGATSEVGQSPPDRRDPRWMREARRALYDGEIAANDHWFAVFLERLDELGLADDTLLIFMSDHGEHLGEHDLWSHNPPGYVQVLHTPLIMVYPRHLQEGVVVEEIVQNLDIMPTILELAGVDGSELLMQGDSLLPLMVEQPTNAWSRNLAYSEEALLKKSREDPRAYGSVFFERWHLLDSLYAPMKLFDIGLDPTEGNSLRPARNLSSRVPAFLRDMRLAELEIWRSVTGGEEQVVTLDPESIDELKALGYLE